MFDAIFPPCQVNYKSAVMASFMPYYELHLWLIYSVKYLNK